MCPTDLVTKNQSSFDRHTFMLCDLSNIFKYFWMKNLQKVLRYVLYRFHHLKILLTSILFENMNHHCFQVSFFDRMKKVIQKISCQYCKSGSSIKEQKL